MGVRPLADDEVLRGAAALAARVLTRLAAAPSTNAMRVQELLRLRDTDVDIAMTTRKLGMATDGRVAVIGFLAAGSAPARLTDVLALSTSAFRADAQVTSGLRPGVRAATAYRQGADVMDPWRHRHAARRAGGSNCEQSSPLPQRDSPEWRRAAPRSIACSPRRLRAYLDCFGDIGTVARWLHVHPSTVRYRVRRIETLLGTSLEDPDLLLLLSLGLRTT